METFSALLAICVGNSPVPGDFLIQRPVTRSFDVFFNLRLNKRLSKQSWGWWFETLSRPLWRQCNGYLPFTINISERGSVQYWWCDPRMELIEHSGFEIMDRIHTDHGWVVSCSLAQKNGLPECSTIHVWRATSDSNTVARRPFRAIPGNRTNGVVKAWTCPVILVSRPQRRDGVWEKIYWSMTVYMLHYFEAI